MNSTVSTQESFMMRIRRPRRLLFLSGTTIFVLSLVLYFNWTRDKSLSPLSLRDSGEVSKSIHSNEEHIHKTINTIQRLEPMATTFKTYRSSSNDFKDANPLWFTANCLGGPTHNIAIENISIIIDLWRKSFNPICRELLKMFSEVYVVRGRTASVTIPDSFALKVLGWLGNKKELLEEARLQHITTIDNLYTQESTVFNPLRGKRPGAGGEATPETKKYVADIIKTSAEDCDFCNYKTMTASDPFGSIESRHSVTVSNTFKVEKFHGLVIWKHHNPLEIYEEQLLDALETAQKWFQEAHLLDKKYTIPHIYWDTLPKASASQIHPHFHVTLARDSYYARWNRFHAAAVHYAVSHHGDNYFTTLYRIHNMLGLAAQFGNASVMAYLTPSASHEIILISHTPCKDLFRLLYFCVAALRDDMGLYALSAGMVFPKLVPSPNGSDLPTLIRVVYRGAAEVLRADIDSLQLFGTVNVNIDPYMVIGKIKDSIRRRSQHGAR